MTLQRSGKRWGIEKDDRERRFYRWRDRGHDENSSLRTQRENPQPIKISAPTRSRWAGPRELLPDSVGRPIAKINCGFLALHLLCSPAGSSTLRSILTMSRPPEFIQVSCGSEPPPPHIFSGSAGILVLITRICRNSVRLFELGTIGSD